MSLLTEKIIVSTTAPLSLRDVTPYRFPLKIAHDRPVRLILMADDGHPFALNCNAGQLPNVAQTYALTYEYDSERAGPTYNAPCYVEMFGAEERDNGVIEYLHAEVLEYIHQEFESVVEGYEREPECDEEQVYTPAVLWMLSRIRRERSYTYAPNEVDANDEQRARMSPTCAANAVSTTFGPFYSEVEQRERPAVLSTQDIRESRDLLRYAASVLELLAYSDGQTIGQAHRAAELAWALVGRASEALRTSGDEA